MTTEKIEHTKGVIRQTDKYDRKKKGDEKTNNGRKHYTDRTIWTLLKSGDELNCMWRVSRTCSQVTPFALLMLNSGDK